MLCHPRSSCSLTTCSVYENVIPTLDVTESTNQGYSKHILPLAFKHQMVRSSILAASASHIQITQGSKSMVDRLNYRSTALAELRQISARPETDSSAPLATILGLMIDDMICGHRECPALLKLAEFWVRKDCPFSTDATEKATRRFLLDQVQLYVMNYLSCICRIHAASANTVFHGIDWKQSSVLFTNSTSS